MRIYVDTSVVSGLYAQDSRIVESTRIFFQAARHGKFTLYSSNLLAEEIRKTPDLQLRRALVDAVENHHIQILPVSDEVNHLARLYVSEKIIPPRYLADAIHIAFAVMHNIPVLASWNFKHLVKHKTRCEVNRVNKDKGYPPIDLCSPEEL